MSLRLFDDGKLVIQFLDDTVMCLCQDEVFTSGLDKAFSEVLGKKVDYELTSGTMVKESGQYYPPVSVFGMEVTVDDSDFE